ncbi:invasin domain 3-containing protein [Citrobacter koseri]|uniref:invasin domain 3-containing protein n=1 Tax=Citrobacter koseri TaxID=545 RepID=UPI000E0F0550|nr:invasin domain 3-containing protein [Citrobacter koseri]
MFTASPETIAADNSAISTLTLVAKDAQGNALTGLKDSLAFTIKDSSGKAPAAGTLTESAITESSTAGTYTATLTGTTAGKYTIRAGIQRCRNGQPECDGDAHRHPAGREDLHH